MSEQDTPAEPLSTDAFDDIAERIMAKDEAAKPAEAAPSEPATAQAETPASAAGEKEGVAPTRDAQGRFVKQDAQPAAAAAPVPATDAQVPDEFLVEIKGPWGVEKLDPRKPEDRARLIEYGQKGRNYQELIAKDDQRIKRTANELLFDNYRAMGLIGVNPDGTTFWTPKGLKLMQEQDANGAEAPAPRSGQPEMTDDEVDRLADTIFTAEDRTEAKQALVKALAIADKRGSEAARREFEKLWSEKAKELDARETQRRQEAESGSLLNRLNARLTDELKKHSLTDRYLKDSATELVRREMSRLERAGVPSEKAFEEAIVEIANYARALQGLKSKGVQENVAAAAAQKAAPPATGSGAAPPPKPAQRPAVNRRDPFGDEFQERVVTKLRAGAPA